MPVKKTKQAKAASPTYVFFIGVPFILCVALGICFYTFRSTAASDTADLNTVPLNEFSSDMFSITLPDGWAKVRDTDSYATFKNLKETHPESSIAHKKSYHSSIEIRFDSATGKTLDEVTASIVGEYQAEDAAFAVHNTITGVISGVPAQFMESLTTQQGMGLQGVVAVVLNNNRYFVVSCMTTELFWPIYRDLFYNTLSTFHFAAGS
ncbi:MAG: hypothetical protein PHY34_03225 [Patescibacteria group bacterium]|nr:hypothetical protein [Patescibacteria group bacterium]MDD5716113.1 hypothetical protein [Patescibacteria group bacterium]